MKMLTDYHRYCDAMGIRYDDVPSRQAFVAGASTVLLRLRECRDHNDAADLLGELEGMLTTIEDELSGETSLTA